ncbi:MAG: MBL fold metallo-hydrolase [Acidobacteriota bacterium]
MIRQLRAPNPGPFTLDGTNTYIVDDVAIIDPGPASRPHVDRLLAAAPLLEKILITHRHGDHAPGAIDLAWRSGAIVIAPPGVLNDDLVHRRLVDGDEIKAGQTILEAIATPGHTAEHFCFLSREGDLFTGDMILGAGTTAIFPPDGNMGQYLHSLEGLRTRHPKRIFPGHGPIRDDAVPLIDSYIEHRRMREGEVIEQLAPGPMTIPELRAKIYPDLAEGLEPAAEAQLLAHLTHLREQGKVDEEGEFYGLTR